MDSSDPLAGRLVLDRYRLGERIGIGGMAEVRRADDIRLDRPVAVKFLAAPLASQPDLRRRFEDEARSAARLSHPAVVQVFDSGEWEGRPFLVMELLSGRTLADEMAGGPLPVDRVRQAAADVLAALGAAHSAGVVHRDVKPANLLIAPDGSVKIADFGIAKADPLQGERSATDPAPATMTGQLIGTPSYLAPERVTGQPATPATDLWALGVVCWEALTGQRAFPGVGIQTAMAVATTDLAPVRDLRPDTDPDLARAIDIAVRRDPSARWTSAAAMRAALLGTRTPEATVIDVPVTGAVSGWADTGFAGTAGAADTVVRQIPRPQVRSAGAWGRNPGVGNRLAVFGLIAIAVIAAIIALAALAGGGHKKIVATTPPPASTSMAPTTSTSTSTSTTVPPPPSPAPRKPGHKGP